MTASGFVIGISCHAIANLFEKLFWRDAKSPGWHCIREARPAQEEDTASSLVADTVPHSSVVIPSCFVIRHFSRIQVAE
jgi:hypothetical protein